MARHDIWGKPLHERKGRDMGHYDDQRANHEAAPASDHTPPAPPQGATFKTSCGPAGAASLFFNQEAHDWLKELGFTRDDGSVAVKGSLLHGGSVLLALPDAEGAGLRRRLSRIKQPGPHQGWYNASVGYVVEHNLTMEQVGGPWRMEEVPAYANRSGTTIALAAPETRQQPGTHPRPRRRPFSTEEIDFVCNPKGEEVVDVDYTEVETRVLAHAASFLGEFPDGSTGMFQLTWAQTLELNRWLEERMVKVTYG